MEPWTKQSLQRENDFEKGRQALHKGAFEEALQLWRAYLQEVPEDEKALRYCSELERYLVHKSNVSVHQQPRNEGVTDVKEDAFPFQSVAREKLLKCLRMQPFDF